jgi:glycosyltransferase involved in cell wall biosynthesis
MPIQYAEIINRFGAQFRHTIMALDGNTDCASRLDPALGVALATPGIDKSRPLQSLFRIRRNLSRLRPDLLLTYNWGAIEWALVNSLAVLLPHIHLEHGFGPEEVDRQMPRRVLARRLALRRARLIVVPSHTLAGIARDIWKLDPARILHIPNGVDCDLYGSAVDADEAPGFSPRKGELIIGTVAPLRSEKNLARLLRAFARIAPDREARLLIVGDGVERPALEALARSLKLDDRIVFTGHVEHPEKVYPLMDVFAITSDTEQMPNTVIQAMAASLPVAGVDVGDVKSVLSPDNRGLVVDRADEDGFAAMLGKLLDDGGLRVSLATANRRHVVAEYSAETMVDAYADIFEQALA